MKKNQFLVGAEGDEILAGNFDHVWLFPDVDVFEASGEAL